MCGIVAYTGSKRAIPILMDGLRRLEYRGYDSAGLAWQEKDQLQVVKSPGKLSALAEQLTLAEVNGAQCGIGHTRWATHGVPNQVNAHPHLDAGHNLALVHNGIIENHAQLREQLEDKGYVFVSDTDTEVVCHLLAEELTQQPSIPSALSYALARIEGSYALCIMNKEQPGTIYAARKSSPLILGVGEEECFIASDVPAFLPYTREVVFLEDDEIIEARPSGWSVHCASSLAQKDRSCARIDWDVQAAEKGGYPHFMLKEIYEQPRVIQDCLRGRIDPKAHKVYIPELEALPRPQKLRIVACGTSFHAGLWAQYVFEQLTSIPVEVQIASEFRYRKVNFEPDELVVAISQSGETADTFAGLEKAHASGVQVLGLCNVLGSSIARASDVVLYTQAGPEISVASTKPMCSQMVALVLLALSWGRQSGTVDARAENELVAALYNLPGVLEQSIDQVRARIQELVPAYQQARSFLFLGRGLGYPLALEGALKLKEISYIHAEGYAAGEMKHGPIALIDPAFPTFAIALKDDVLSKNLSNLQEIQARQGRIIVLTQCGVCLQDASRCEIPECHPLLDSFLVLPALQLFAYEMAVALGTDVDQPRNLAKSVTVE
ncbi:MAG: glutamine--fructose-6-phosphate transaminase (isomerizing) [Desulfovermiculus sp.]